MNSQLESINKSPIFLIDRCCEWRPGRGRHIPPDQNNGAQKNQRDIWRVLAIHSVPRLSHGPLQLPEHLLSLQSLLVAVSANLGFFPADGHLALILGPAAALAIGRHGHIPWTERPPNSQCPFLSEGLWRREEHVLADGSACRFSLWVALWKKQVLWMCGGLEWADGWARVLAQGRGS